MNNPIQSPTLTNQAIKTYFDLLRHEEQVEITKKKLADLSMQMDSFECAEYMKLSGARTAFCRRSSDTPDTLDRRRNSDRF